MREKEYKVEHDEHTGFTTFEYSPRPNTTKFVRFDQIEHVIQFEDLLREAGYRMERPATTEVSLTREASKWIDYTGFIKRETEKAVLLDGPLGWVPKKAVRTVGDRIQVANWIMKVKATEGAKGGRVNKTKAELVKETEQKLSESAGRVLRFENDTEKFYGNVDKVLDKILS